MELKVCHVPLQLSFVKYKEEATAWMNEICRGINVQ